MIFFLLIVILGGGIVHSLFSALVLEGHDRIGFIFMTVLYSVAMSLAIYSKVVLHWQG